MELLSLKENIILTFSKYFPDAHIVSTVKRNIILEIKIEIEEEIFIEIYCNSLTGKKSFALIKSNKRIFGYDNYKFWHYHPYNASESHIKCKEPSIEEVASEIYKIMKQINNL